MSPLAALLTLAAAAAAQPPVFRPGEAEAARFHQAFAAAEALYQAGDYGAAVASFRLADRLRATPEVAFDLARCHERLGDQAFALYYDRLYLRRAPAAADTLDVAQRVGKALGRVQGEGLGFLELDAPRGSQLTVDGRLYPEGPVAAFLPPGEHEVAADFPGGRKVTRLQLRPGKALTFTFEPVPPPLLGTEQALSEAVLAAGGGAAGGPGLSGLQVGSVIAGGVGVAALAGGVVLALLAAADANRASTDRTLTAADAQALAGQAATKSTISSVLFGVGGAAVASGGVLLVVSFTEPAP